MKCPKLSGITFTEEDGLFHHQVECIKEECAWWDSGPEWCVLRSLTESLIIIGQELTQIKDKMPHEEQFRK